jgi:hypothetical protein
MSEMGNKLLTLVESDGHTVCVTQIVIVDNTGTGSGNGYYNEDGTPNEEYTGYQQYNTVQSKTCWSIDPKDPPGTYKDPATQQFTPRNPFGHRRAIHDTVDLTPHGNTKWTANCPTTHYNANRFESESSVNKNYCHPIYLLPKDRYQSFIPRTQ